MENKFLFYGVTELTVEEQLSIDGGNFASGRATGKEAGATARKAVDNCTLLVLAVTVLSGGRIRI